MGKSTVKKLWDQAAEALSQMGPAEQLHAIGGPNPRKWKKCRNIRRFSSNIIASFLPFMVGTAAVYVEEKIDNMAEFKKRKVKLKTARKQQNLYKVCKHGIKNININSIDDKRNEISKAIRRYNAAMQCASINKINDDNRGSFESLVYDLALQYLTLRKMISSLTEEIDNITEVLSITSKWAELQEQTLPKRDELWAIMDTILSSKLPRLAHPYIGVDGKVVINDIRDIVIENLIHFKVPEQKYGDRLQATLHWNRMRPITSNKGKSPRIPTPSPKGKRTISPPSAESPAPSPRICNQRTANKGLHDIINDTDKINMKASPSSKHRINRQSRYQLHVPKAWQMSYKGSKRSFKVIYNPPPDHNCGWACVNHILQKVDKTPTASITDLLNKLGTILKRHPRTTTAPKNGPLPRTPETPRSRFKKIHDKNASIGIGKWLTQDEITFILKYICTNPITIHFLYYNEIRDYWDDQFPVRDLRNAGHYIALIPASADADINHWVVLAET